MTAAAASRAAIWRSLLRWGLDLVLAVGAASLAVGLYFEQVRGSGEPVSPAAVIVAGVYGAVLLTRRIWPLATLSVMLVMAALYTLVLGFPVLTLGPAIVFAIYSAAAGLERKRSLPALLVVELTLVLLLTAEPSFPGWGAVLQFGLVFAAAWFLGDLVRRWRTAAETHEARAVELARAREELARRAVGEERLRIARELHDVVTHSMTVVALHAASGRLKGQTNHEAAQAALRTIEHSSREALGDMRRLVKVLREEEGPAPDPTPGLGDIDRLAEEIERAGVLVSVRKEGPLDEVPAGLSLAVYRIAQEALTNVVRHSGARSVQLTLIRAGARLSLSVRNDPPTDTVPPSDEGGGHGILGMAERASLYGGSLVTGVMPDGGYKVEARFPVDGLAE